MQRFAVSFSFVCLSALLSGCAMQTTATPSPPATIKGNVHGGNQPVDHARIQLYAVGLGNYSAPASPLITNTIVYTDSIGNFVINGDYLCPTPSTVDTQVYITATGGNPGLDGDPNNSALALMTALGSCSALTDATSVNINELTTVASVWSLAQFMSGYTRVGTTINNYTGLKNAFFTSTQLVSYHYGLAVPSTTNTTIPIAELDSLANILSTCVNSAGDTSTPGTPCSKLFAATKPSVGPEPTDTIGAALNIALNPLANVSTLFNLSTANPAFEPALTTAPPDWTIGILTWGNAYTKYPMAGVVDAENNYWETGNYQSPHVAVSGPDAMYNDTNYFFFAAAAPAFGQGGRLYMTNANNQAGYGGYTSSSQFEGQTGGGLTSSEYPSSIAIAPNGNLWMPIRNNGALAEFLPPTTPVSPAGGFTGLLNTPAGGDASFQSAFDSNSNLYVLDAQTSIAKINTNPITPTATTISGGGVNYPGSPAIDHDGDLWVLNEPVGQSATCCVTVSEFDSAGTPLTTTAYAPGNFNANDLAVDGLGRLWLSYGQSSQSTPAGVATFAPDLSSPATVLGTAFAPTIPAGEFNPPEVGSQTFSIAIDQSGNVWTTEAGSRVNPTYFSNPNLELVGLAGPVATPLSVAVKNNTLGTRP